MIAACAIALCVSAILLWMGRPSLIAAGAILAIGLVGGAISAASVRVSFASAAAEIDRRFQLKDLLATAWHVRESKADGNPWRMAVLRMAEERCGGINVNLLSRPIASGKTWSAMALAVALIVTLGFFSPRSQPVTLAEQLQVIQQSLGATPSQATEAQMQRARPPGESPSDEQAYRPSGQPTDSTAGPTIAGENGGHSQSGDASAGSGLARTSTPMQRASEATLAGAGDSNQTGQIAGGAGGSGHTSGTGAAVTGKSRSDVPARDVPPWQTSSWPAAQAAAMAEINENRIDPAARDLVQDYFSRP